MYEESFYQKGNIIGYTGNINLKPTIYFQKDTKFGRITQEHPDSTNVGRNKVRTAADYKIANGTNGNAEEYYNGAVRHRSRNPFKTAGWFDKIKLAKAIDLFKELKPR
jgi:hypothetical protein